MSQSDPKSDKPLWVAKSLFFMCLVLLVGSLLFFLLNFIQAFSGFSLPIKFNSNEYITGSALVTTLSALISAVGVWVAYQKFVKDAQEVEEKRFKEQQEQYKKEQEQKKFETSERIHYRWIEFSATVRSSILRQILSSPISVVCLPNCYRADESREFFIDWSYQSPYSTAVRNKNALNPIDPQYTLEWFDGHISTLELQTKRLGKNREQEQKEVNVFLKKNIYHKAKNIKQPLTIEDLIDALKEYFDARVKGFHVDAQESHFQQLVNEVLPHFVRIIEFRGEAEHVPTNLVSHEAHQMFYSSTKIIQSYKRLIVTAYFLFTLGFIDLTTIFRDAVDPEVTDLNPKHQTLLGYFDEFFQQITQIEMALEQGFLDEESILQDIWTLIDNFENVITAGFPETTSSKNVEDFVYYSCILHYLITKYPKVIPFMHRRHQNVSKTQNPLSYRRRQCFWDRLIDILVSRNHENTRIWNKLTIRIQKELTKERYQEFQKLTRYKFPDKANQNKSTIKYPPYA